MHLAVPIQRSVDESIEALRAIHSFYEAAGTVTRRQFKAFGRREVSEHTSIQALEWIPRVRDAERATYEATARRNGFPDFHITERNAQGRMVRAARRAEYFPVYYVEPYKGNEVALGFDLASNPARLAALERARDTGAPAATPRIVLVQEVGEQFGFLIFVPIYRSGSSLETVEERRRSLLGFALGVLRIGDLVEASLRGFNVENIGIEIYDEAAPAGERLLYRHGKREPHAAVYTIDPDDSKGPTGLHWKTTFEVAGRQWSLLFVPTPQYLAAQRSWQPWGVLVICVLLTAMLAAYLSMSIGRADLLGKAKESLENETFARKQAEEGLVRRTQQLEELRAVSEEITRELDLDRVLDLIIRRAVELIGADSGIIRLWDEAQQLLMAKSAVGVPPARLFSLRLGEAVTGLVAQRREGLIVNDFRTSPLIPPHIRETTSFFHVLGQPFLYRDQLVGAITINRESPGRLFTNEDQDFLGLLATQATIAIENARLHEAVRRHATELEERVRERTAELEEALRAKSEFLSNMSHELRTPLNAIIGFAQVLQEQRSAGPLTEKQASYLDHIPRAGERLLRLIKDILDLSQAWGGQISLRPQAIPVAETLEGLLALAQGLAPKKGQTLEAMIASDLPPLHADPIRFKQIVFNLLDNAVKFTPWEKAVSRKQKAASTRQRMGGPGCLLPTAYCLLRSSSNCA